MSSYVSGVYGFVENTINRIRNQAFLELQGLTEEIARNEAAHELHLSECESQEMAKQEIERKREQSAEVMFVNSSMNQHAIHLEADILLSDATNRVLGLEVECPGRNHILAKLQSLREGIARYGVTEESIVKIRELTQKTIPETITQLTLNEAQQILDESMQNRLQVHSTVTDQSMRFVSMKVHRREKRQEPTAWELFVQKIQLLAKQQQEFGDTGALEMLSEISKLAPNQRSMYMVHNRNIVQTWEEEVSIFNATLRMESKRKAELLTKYSALRVLCTSFYKAPNISEADNLDVLQHEYDKAMERYIEHRKQQYLEETLRNVFEARGFTFENMSSDSKNRFYVEFSMGTDNGIRIMRSDSGAFEMIFMGKSSTNEITQNQRRSATERAKSFCDLLPDISSDLKKHGILLDPEMIQTPTEDIIIFEIDQKRSISTQATTQKRYMN